MIVYLLWNSKFRVVHKTHVFMTTFENIVWQENTWCSNNAICSEQSWLEPGHFLIYPFLNIMYNISWYSQRICDGTQIFWLSIKLVVLLGTSCDKSTLGTHFFWHPLKFHKMDNLKLTSTLIMLKLSKGCLYFGCYSPSWRQCSEI